MNKRVIAMCVMVGSTVGGYVPVMFGQGSFSAASFIGSFLGGVAGVLAAKRIDADF